MSNESNKPPTAAAPTPSPANILRKYPSGRNKPGAKDPNFWPILTQAERVIAKFGGARRLAEAFKTAGFYKGPASIYKWTYPREKGGTAGVIPTKAWPILHKVARLNGVLITAQDMDVRPMRVPGLYNSDARAREQELLAEEKAKALVKEHGLAEDIFK